MPLSADIKAIALCCPSSFISKSHQSAFSVEIDKLSTFDAIAQNRGISVRSGCVHGYKGWVYSISSRIHDITAGQSRLIPLSCRSGQPCDASGSASMVCRRERGGVVLRQSCDGMGVHRYYMLNIPTEPFQIKLVIPLHG